jgi:Zn-dependent protease with chaperone function
VLTLGCALVLYAVATMIAVPRALAGRRWAFRNPRTALGIWLVGLTSGVLAVLTSLALLVNEAIRLSEPGRAGDMRTSHVAGSVAVFVLAWVLSAVVGGVGCLTVFRAVPQITDIARTRRAVLSELRRTAWADVVSDRVVLCCSGAVPAVLSIPGRHGGIVVSSTVRDVLSEAELAAAVEHERAHLRAHHSLVMQIACLHRSCMPTMASALAFERAITVLVELAADDSAARRCGTGVTAAALTKLSTLTADASLLVRASRVAA